MNKIGIICYGARATRLGERLLRSLHSHLAKEGKTEIYDLIISYPLISFPEDYEKIDTGLDIYYQILFLDNEKIISDAKCFAEKFNNKVRTFVIDNDGRSLDFPHTDVYAKDLSSIFINSLT